MCDGWHTRRAILPSISQGAPARGVSAKEAPLHLQRRHLSRSSVDMLRLRRSPRGERKDSLCWKDVLCLCFSRTLTARSGVGAKRHAHGFFCVEF